MGDGKETSDCVTVVWGKGTLVTHVPEAESVELKDARAVTIGYFMRRKYIHTNIHTYFIA